MRCQSQERTTQDLCCSGDDCGREHGRVSIGCGQRRVSLNQSSLQIETATINRHKRRGGSCYFHLKTSGTQDRRFASRRLPVSDFRVTCQTKLISSDSAQCLPQRRERKEGLELTLFVRNDTINPLLHHTTRSAHLIQAIVPIARHHRPSHVGVQIRPATFAHLGFFRRSFFCNHAACFNRSRSIFTLCPETRAQLRSQIQSHHGSYTTRAFYLCVCHCRSCC